MLLGHAVIKARITPSTIPFLPGQVKSTGLQNTTTLTNRTPYSATRPRGKSRLFSIIIVLTGCERCDERFIGYGANKAACLFGMSVAGMEFYILADHFLIHRSHLYAEKARATEV
jgi:hypothetical protein